MRNEFIALLVVSALATDLHSEALEAEVSWIGNSFSGGDAGWVPQDVADMFVTPDGSVFTTVGWEEHRGNLAEFNNGKLIRQSAHWKNGGIDRLVGESICANEKHVYFATGQPDEHDGKIKGTFLARRDRSDISSRSAEIRVKAGSAIQGVAVGGKTVFASCADGVLRKYDLDLKPVGEWPLPNGGEIALDSKGGLWIIETETRVIRHRDMDGADLKPDLVLPEGVVPTDLAITPDDRLLVADGGRNRQVLIYTGLGTKPVLDRTFGEKGGIYSGPVRGAFGDRRFVSPIGVGADREGNLYVANGPYGDHHGGTTIIESYAPDDSLNWRVLSTEWLDTVDAADDATALYGSKYRYAFDPELPIGKQWKVEAITLDPDRFPEDPRLKGADRGGVWHREINGRRYLFMPDMNGGNLFVFRFDPEKLGEIAAPCARIGTQDLWIDLDGDGKQGENETSKLNSGETRGWYVEENGTVWQATLGDGIYEHPLVETLADGVPVYRADRRKHRTMPKPFTQLRRIAYERAKDVMYLGGSTEADKAHHWKPMGPNLVRYDHWSAEPEVAWSKVFPHEAGPGGHESFEPFDFAMAGECLFVVYAGTLPSLDLPMGTVMVVEKEDGNSIGHFQPTGIRAGEAPMDALQDMVHSINAHQRENGEYIVFIEDDGYTKNIVYRWKR